MDKIYYKELIEKYFDGNITDAEIKELSDWIKNDRQLQFTELVGRRIFQIGCRY